MAKVYANQAGRAERRVQASAEVDQSSSETRIMSTGMIGHRQAPSSPLCLKSNRPSLCSVQPSPHVNQCESIDDNSYIPYTQNAAGFYHR